MRILSLLGSPRANGTTHRMARLVAGGLSGGGPVEEIALQEKHIRPCRGCQSCDAAPHVCPLARTDDAEAVFAAIAAADVVLWTSPVYFYGLPAQAKALVDRSQRIWAGVEAGRPAGKGPLVLAALAAWKTWFRELMAPLVAGIKAVPVASFIILALVWLNSRSLSLFISALMVFPPVYLNVLEGICRTDRRLLEMARVFRVPLGRRLRGIYLPQVMPYFRTAVSLGLGLCWKAGAAAEIIGLPAGSMGERLYTAKVYFQTADLFAWTVTIVAVSVAFERLFLALVDRLMGKAGL